MKDPSTKSLCLEKLSTCFGLGTNAAGRYNFVTVEIVNTGACTTPVVGRGALMANRA